MQTLDRLLNLVFKAKLLTFNSPQTNPTHGLTQPTSMSGSNMALTPYTHTTHNYTLWGGVPWRALTHDQETCTGNLYETFDCMPFCRPRQSSRYKTTHCSRIVSYVFSASCLERPIPLFANKDSGISDPCFTLSSLRLWNMDRTRRWRKTPGSVPYDYEVPTPNYEDPLAGPYTEHRSCVTHRPLPSIGPHHASPERCLWTHR